MLPKNCVRIDENRMRIDGSIPTTIFATEQVMVEDAAVDELAELLSLQDTAKKMYEQEPENFSAPPTIERVSLSPDFHKGAGIPIGTTMVTKGFCVPQAVGNDINCGVRLHTTTIQRDTLSKALNRLETPLRHVYFEGGRDIPFTAMERAALLTNGLTGLLDAHKSHGVAEGIWTKFSLDQAELDVARTKHRGTLKTYDVFGLDDYIDRPGITRDSQIGSIGGGNHFVEIQYVHKILNGEAAFAYGLKKDAVVIMVHSGSVNVGHLCGEAYKDLVRSIYPKKLGYPANGIFPLPDKHPAFAKFFTALHNAANFAFANRMFLAAMMHQVLTEVIGKHRFELLYDSPHNLTWQQSDGTNLHRKGACPAGGYGEGAYPYHGEPVLVPGSMGSASFVLEGQGNEEALGTASHGAGRKLSRGDALHYDEAAFEQFLREYRVVTPIDPKRHDIRNRPEIIAKWKESLKKEAPFAYKDVYPIIDTLRNAGVAKPVAELRPLLTLKG